MVSRLPFGDEGDGFAVDLSQLFGQRRDSHLDACDEISRTLTDHVLNRNDYNDTLRTQIDNLSDLLIVCAPYANDNNFGNASTQDRVKLFDFIVQRSDQWLGIGSNLVNSQALKDMLIWQRASIAFTVIVLILNSLNHWIASADVATLAWSASHPDFSIQPCACNRHSNDDAVQG